MEAFTDSLGVCVRHPANKAASACTRCGNFTCDDCLGLPGRANYGYCADCRERLGAVPWEAAEQPWWRRYTETVKAALVRPVHTFAAVGSGPLGPPMGFAALSSFIGFAPLLFVVIPLAAVVLWAIGERFPTEAMEPNMAGMMVLTIPCAMVFYPSLSLVYFTSIGMIFHGVAFLLGGRGTFSQSMRGAYYTTAWEAVSGLAMGLYCVPIVGALLILCGWFVGAAWRGVALKAHAERVHGLSSGAATAAAAIAAGFWLTVLMVAVGISLVVILADRAGGI